MRNTKVLEMLDAGRIEELRTMLQEEIYLESLNTKTGVKKRYSAMKRYFSYTDHAREILRRPSIVEFEDKQYTSFTNSWSLALTTESPGEIELFDKSYGKYPDVTRLLSFEGIKKRIDIQRVIAEARSKGYRRSKKEVGPGFRYLMKYDEGFFKIGLLDVTYAIIDNGDIPMTYHAGEGYNPLTIQTELGFCMIMSVRFDGEPDGKVIIEVE